MLEKVICVVKHSEHMAGITVKRKKAGRKKRKKKAGKAKCSCWIKM